MQDAGDSAGLPRRGIAVFGASDAQPGSADWDAAHAIGARLGLLGLPVVTGGYGGVMEAASRGARTTDGEALGVTCGLFEGRAPNPFLTLEIAEPDLFTRTARLFALARGFVVLGGGAWTLAELGLLWAHARAGALPGPIVLLDGAWSALFAQLVAAGRLERAAVRATAVARDAEHALALALAPGPV